MKTEWWYDNSFFAYGVSETLELARLTVRDDGTAAILTPCKSLEFPSAMDAELWLSDEEYAPLELLREELAEKGLPVDPRLQAPSGEDVVQLRRQMVIPLTPTRPCPSSASAVLDQGLLTPPLNPKIS